MVSFLPSIVSETLSPAPITISIRANRPTKLVSPTLYGVFFEEINGAGDGGLSADPLRNGGLESINGTGSPAPDPTVAWKLSPGVTIVNDGPNAAHMKALALPANATAANLGVGKAGISIKAGERYRVVVWAKGPGTVGVGFGTGSIRMGRPGDGWKQLETTVRAVSTAPNVDLVFTALEGPVEIGYTAFEPTTTWRGRKNGLRPDLAGLVEAMHPSFVRFPGGCYIEGGDRFADAFDWKASLGPLEERRGLARSMWGYPVGYRLGYHEYLQWCEDLGAAPLYVVNCGLNHAQATPLEKMDEWIQSALDAIEYANGPVTSKWGAERAKAGHPKPFGLRYVEIGNENGLSWSFGGPAAYAPRYKLVHDAIKAKYPEIVTLADAPVPGGAEVVDEHYYSDPAWFWRNKDRYDAYDRGGPKVYVGEYAVTQGAGRGNLGAALAEAAFMTGMERNSDVVQMASYAPLLANVHDEQWNPNAILFDAARVYGTPSYHVQAMFAANRADRNVELSLPSSLAPPPAARGGGIGLMTWNTRAEFTDLRLSASGRTLYESGRLRADGLSNARGDWSVSGGVLGQRSLEPDRAIEIKGAAAPAGDYTLDLKARKVEGQEGFLVVVDMRDGHQLRWNVGGWGNTGTAFEHDGEQVGDRVPVTIQAGRWYDVRIEHRGDAVLGYLDGKFVQELRESPAPDLAAVAGIDDKAHELVLKVVNGSEDARTTTLDLSGARPGEVAKSIVLTGPSLQAENNFDTPNSVAPTTLSVRWDGTYTFLPRSVTVLRVPIR